MYRHVEIGKEIEGEKLEKILVEAAEEMGLKAKAIDEHRTEYTFNTRGEEEVYRETKINLKGRFFPFAEITGIDKKCPFCNRGFAIWTFPDYGWGFASKKQIENYLSKVFEKLDTELN